MWQLHVWMQLGPQCAGGQAESTARMESSVRVLRPVPRREDPTRLTQLLACDRSAVSIRIEKDRAPHLSQFQMVMLMATAPIMTDMVFVHRLQGEVGRVNIIPNLQI